MLIKHLDCGYEMIANSYLLFDEESGESAVVDPGLCAGEVEAAAEKYKVKYILLTHGHFDHILGAYDLKQLTGAQVVIHELDEECLYNRVKSLAQQNDAPQQHPLHADVLLSGGEVLHLGKTPISVMHTPGHTKGGVCYIIESEKTIISGDTLFCMTVGRTDFDGGSPAELARSLKRLIDLEGNYRVLPGHNRETTLDGERTRNRFIRRMDVLL